MSIKNIDHDFAKELLIVLSYCDDTFIKNIPKNILKNLNDLAATSTKDFYVTKNKSLMEQDISENCKDLLATLYFMYMIDSTSKNEVLDIWTQNEKKININFKDITNE